METKLLRLIYTCCMFLALVILIAIVCIKTQPLQQWFNGITQEEFDQLGAKEQLELIVQQFNSSGYIFTSNFLRM